MTILLTHDQESTIWNFSDTIVTTSGQRFYGMPFFLKPLGGGMYERLSFNQLPDDAKDMVLAKQGIKLPSND